MDQLQRVYPLLERVKQGRTGSGFVDTGIYVPHDVQQCTATVRTVRFLPHSYFDVRCAVDRGFACASLTCTGK